VSGHGEYSELLLDHYRRPRNAGDLARPDVMVTVGSPDHGDVMRLSLRIADGRVAEAGFKVFGCAAAIAAGSMTTEMIRGRRLEEVEAITNQQVAEALGGLPESKIHCSVLAEQALRQALSEYRGRMSEQSQDAQRETDTISGPRG
jgi:NifU-like protein involved in Fe-S cluster formation